MTVRAQRDDLSMKPGHRRERTRRTYTTAYLLHYTLNDAAYHLHYTQKTRCVPLALYARRSLGVARSPFSVIVFALKKKIDFRLHVDQGDMKNENKIVVCLNT